MTISALGNCKYIDYVVDKNPRGKENLMPRSHLEVFGLEKLVEKRADVILIFSFGYYREIVKELTGKYSYRKRQIISLLDIM